MFKIFIALALCGLTVQVLGDHYPHGHGNGGVSKVYQKQDGKGNYAFGYNVLDPKGASNYREESGDAWGNKVGSYGLKDKDGRLRIVHYVADKNGFRVKIDSNEPGVASVDSAHASFNGPDYHGSKVAHVAHQRPYTHHKESNYDDHRHVIPSVPSLPKIHHVEKSNYKKKDEYDVDVDVEIPAIPDVLKK